MQPVRAQIPTERWVPLSRPSSSLRWVVIGVFILSNILNFLDRQLLAAQAPAIKEEFGLSNAQYGMLVSSWTCPHF